MGQPPVSREKRPQLWTRRPRLLRASRVFVATAALLLLTGCTPLTNTGPSEQPVTPTPTSSPSPSDASSSATATPVPSPTPTSTLTAHDGCSPTSAIVPKNAVTAPIGDVDGDGRSDREWAAQNGGDLTLGVQTASHAVFSITASFAGGAPRSGFVARLAHSTVAIASEQRDARLFTLVGCHFVPTSTTSHGQRFYLSIDTYTGRGNFAPDTGTGTTCLDGQLYALQAVGQTQPRIVRTALTVNQAGTRVTLGAPVTVALHPTQEQVSRTSSLSCGTTKILRPSTP